ncbi:MAG: band-7 C-terminal domain-containing protein, partial [Bradyrhizobium sp.]
IATAAVVEGGIEALQMQLAKAFIDQWGNLAKQGTTMIIPTDLSNIGSVVGTAMQIVKATSGAALNEPPQPRGSVPNAG